VIQIPEDVIERIIREDVPSLDLTTWTLGLGGQPGVLRCTSREDIVVCGTEEAARIGARLGVTSTSGPPSGTRVGADGVVLEAHGDAAALHQAGGRR
jgi:molybdenum transport protein